MPAFGPRAPLVNLDFASIHSIDTSNLTQIHSLWSVFHKCADAMEDGKRLENLSWRIYSRETFCCANERTQPQLLDIDRKRTDTSPEDQMPSLSCSVDSNDSDAGLEIAISRRPSTKRSNAMKQISNQRKSRREKHITSSDLEKIVNTIKEKQDIVPLSPLPSSLTPAEPDATCSVHEIAVPDCTPQPSPSTQSPSIALVIADLSSSTVGTAGTMGSSELSDNSLPPASCLATSNELNSTSIVRGFSKDHISSSARSQVQLAPPLVPMFSSPRNRAVALPKKKGATFMIGGSSGENDSSFENSFVQSSLTSVLKQSAGKKNTSFNEEAATRTVQDRPYESEEVFEDTDEDDEDYSESAIEEDDVDEEWEDDDEPSIPASLNEKEMFQRVDSKPNLVSRRSMLTSLMHEKDRAGALLENANSRSSSAIRRSRTTSPNGPLGTSPPTSIAQGLAQPSRARPIIMTTSNTHPPALSPRTTRQNMLSTELTASLRKNLLWARQVKNSTTNAALKRRHTAHDMKNLQHYPGEVHVKTLLAPTPERQNTNSWSNTYFDTGLQEYHQKGW